MKRFFRMFCMVVFCVLLSQMSVQAGAKVVKVTEKTTYTSKIQRTYLYGKDKNGKIVWKYRCNRYPATELRATSFAVWKNYVYVIEDRNFIKLNKQTGKRVAMKKKALPGSAWSCVMKVDSSGNLYVNGYYGNTLYKLSSKGKVLWKRNLSSKIFWPTKMQVSKTTVAVYYDCCGSPRKLRFSAKTGKLLSQTKGSSIR